MNRGFSLFCFLLVLIPTTNPATAQHLYFSSAPNLCVPYPTPGPCHVYLHSPGDDGFTGATFTLEAPYAWTNLVDLAPAPGVVIVSMIQVPGTGNQPLTADIELLWTQRTLVHEPLLSFAFGNNSYGEASIYDASLARPGGGTEPATGRTTEFVWADCFDPFLMVIIPSPIIIPIGVSTTIDFSWYVEFWGMVGGDLTVSDEKGWVQSWWPSSVGGAEPCFMCFYENSEPGIITVLIPPGTAIGTESAITFDVENFIGCWALPVIKADAPIPVKPSTWGQVKALFE